MHIDYKNGGKELKINCFMYIKMIDLKIRVIRYIPMLLIGLYAAKKMGSFLPLFITWLEIKAMQRETILKLEDKACQTSQNETSSQHN